MHDRFSVTTNAPHVTFSNSFAYSNIKYETELTVNDGVMLPDTLNSVSIKGSIIEQSKYIYSKESANKASFIIEGQYVTGAIEINLSESYTVITEKGVTVTNPIATFNENYATLLNPDEETVLPEETSKVKVKSDGKFIRTDFFKYEKKGDYAILNIFNIAVTGPIVITLSLERGYDVTLGRTDPSCPEINIDKTTAYTYEDYIATISFDNASLPTKKMPRTLQSVKCNDIEIPYTYTTDKTEKNKATIKIDKSLIKGKIDILFHNVIDFDQWNDYLDWWDRCDKVTIDDIGKEVVITVNNHKHVAKLIDIDHDTTTDKKTAHCTFEFESAISNSDGDAIYIYWNEGEEAKNLDFATSTLNNTLNLNFDSVYSKLPQKLQEKIKTAKKSYLKGSGFDSFASKTYNAKLFPLSLDEISYSGGSVNGDEGTSYRYYNENDVNKLKEKRKKYNLKGECIPYWLRSPSTPYNTGAYYITKDGGYNAHFVGTLINFTMTPAFCI